jgi:Skp family chaperone for outer membrane proteins
MRRLRSSLTLSLLALASLLCARTASADIKIGVVDFRQLLEQSPDTRAAMLALEAQYGPRRQEILKLQSDVKSHPDDQDLHRKFEAEAAEFQRQASASRDAAVQKIAASIVEAIGVIASQQGLDLVATDKPLFTGTLSDKTATVVNVTKQVKSLTRHPILSPATPTVPTESPQIKIGEIAGLNLAARTGEEIKLIKDYARDHAIEMVFEKVYYSKPRFVITDITHDVKPRAEWQ